MADQLAERLRRELRVPPSAETRALVEEVRRGRVGTAAPATQLPLPAPLARTTRPEGREQPLAGLKAAWEEAATGTLRIAVATGEPGIGKTTLLGEFARHVHGQGAAVLFGRSDEHGLLPYQPWVEALERHLDALPPVERERGGTTRSRGCCPRSRRPGRAATPPGTATARSRPSARCSRRRPRSARCCWCSTICSGPTRTRCSCCATSRGWPRRRTS